MEENNYGQELNDLDENGNPLSKKEDAKPISSKSLIRFAILFFPIVLLYLILKLFLLKNNKRFIKFKIKEELFYNVSETIINFINKNPYAKISLSADPLLKEVYTNLINEYQKGEVSFKNVQFYSFDGLCGLEKKNNQSYYYTLNKSLLSKIDVQEKNIFLIKEEGFIYLELTENADNYDDFLLYNNSNSIDLQIITLGENGNIGFLDKNTNFDLGVHVVKLNPEIRKRIKNNFGSLEKTPRYGITQGIKNLLNSKEIIVIAIGKEKAKDIKFLMNGDFNPLSPITTLSKYYGKVTIFTDEEAGSFI